MGPNESHLCRKCGDLCPKCGDGVLVARAFRRLQAFERVMLPLSVVGILCVLACLAALANPISAVIDEPPIHGRFGAGFAAGPSIAFLGALVLAPLSALVALFWWWIGRGTVLECDACGKRSLG